MALNFGLLQPVDLGARFMAGQEEAQRNQLAQQQRVQDQELNALRMKQTQGAISQQERQAKTETAAQKTEMFRQRLIRARDPNSVRELVKMQYADRDVGAVLSQGSSLEQALAEVPDDPVQFERYRQQEAMGMSEWIKSQQPKVVGSSIYKPATDTFITPPKETTAPDAMLMQQLGYPLTQAGYQAFRDAQRQERMLTPEEEKQKVRIAAASRAPAQPRPEQPPVAVIGPDGKEIYVTREEALTNRMSPAGKSALTESQGNAAMFGSAMAQAQQVLTQAEREGTTTGAGTVNLAQGIVKYVPLGVGDKLVNDIYALAVNDPTKLFGPDVNQQKVGQAQLAFAIAYLRKTSGAAFGPSEVANTIMEYFPSIGEDKSVVKQKAESRKRAIAGMKMGAGREGAKFIEQYESPSSGASGANKNVITDPKFPGFSIGNP